RAARDELGLPADRVVALCFGAISKRKGVDLVAAAAATTPEILFVIAGAGASELVSPAGNVRVDDGYVDYHTATRYFRGCDFVIQAYRRDYEHDTSGVLVQAALAERPVIVPALPPFRETVTEYDLGATF